jgi:hypothetical protein
MTKEEQKKINDDLLESFRVITKGNIKAMRFLFIWFYYCHEIDDVLDTMEDGRPIQPKEVILRSYARAFEVYNDPFYVEHQKFLFPVAVLVTNSYADSVQWERSPHEHHRLIADVLRCCGNEMLCAVAYLCGTYDDLRRTSAQLWEKTWQMQHDPTGRPI